MEAEAWATVYSPDSGQEIDLINVEPLPEPEADPEVRIDHADTYAEGVDAIPGSFMARPGLIAGMPEQEKEGSRDETR
jgi:hypothetical protein